MALTKSEYTQHLADQQNPDLNKAWGIIGMCEEAQSRLRTEVNFNTPDSPPQLVPLAVITYLTGKYQWSFTMDNVGQNRRIHKITLI